MGTRRTRIRAGRICTDFFWKLRLETYEKIKKRPNPRSHSLYTIHKISKMDLFSMLEGGKTNPIEGLTYIPAFITVEEQQNLLESIDKNEWLNDLKRRVQHYGYKYNYRKRNIDLSMKIGALPNWAIQIGQKLLAQDLIKQEPDQLIINEYLPGQGIANHIDCEPCFEDGIASISLGSACCIEFTNGHNRSEIIPILLEPRSAIVMKGIARYDWQHGIKAVKMDIWQGQKIIRARRVSLTFRKVILN
ncbi:MAG: hypothetical protein RLZZ628_4335 [Bacteroidota bacterium]|jgi:alkylated DNA repair dioxygenase AlkB